MKRLGNTCWLFATAVLAVGCAGESAETPAQDACGASCEDAPSSDGGDVVAPDVAAPDAAQPTAARAFPPGFLFGTAIAGFQVDMGCPTLAAEACEDRNSDWYAFITSEAVKASPNAYLHGDPPAAGPGFWELFEQDFDRARDELGNNAFRFSFEWSRVFPTATDDANTHEELLALADPAALAGYRAQLAALAARGLTPMVTLNHYSLPAWIHDGPGCHLDIDKCSPKGWVDADRTIAEIAKYAGFVGREFGGQVDLWATENEPFAVIFPGYIFPSPDRTNPPAVTLRAAEAKTVFGALIHAHARMVDALRASDTVDADGDGAATFVGLVYAMAPVKPMDPSKPADVKAAENVFYLWNMAFLNAVVKGDFDHDLDGVAERDDSLVGRMDWLGINYYTRITVEGVDVPLLAELSPLTTFNLLTLVPWEAYTRGIYEMAMVVRDFGLPAYVTETGIEDEADDGKMVKWLVETLSWVHQSIEDGADIRGYFFWTLVDNYEWNHGMSIELGLYGVDHTDPEKRRVPRKGVAVYKAITDAWGITDELKATYPIEVE